MLAQHEEARLQSEFGAGEQSSTGDSYVEDDDAAVPRASKPGYADKVHRGNGTGTGKGGRNSIVNFAADDDDRDSLGSHGSAKGRKPLLNSR
jgi:hypothetical protein